MDEFCEGTLYLLGRGIDDSIIIANVCPAASVSVCDSFQDVCVLHSNEARKLSLPLAPHPRHHPSSPASGVMQHLTDESDRLQMFAGERDKVDAQIAALEAANAELVDQQETRV